MFFSGSLWTKIVAVVISCAGCACACDVRVRLDVGELCGQHRLGEGGTVYASFRGVPYAKQPVGPLRFKELQPLDPWEGFLDATTEGPVCPQVEEFYGSLMRPQGMSEACIYANVHVPSLNSQADGASPALPIVIFVHGGGFSAGSGDADIYGPEFLVAKGLLVITFNYRLNVFGFLSLNSSAVPGNNGLRDMITLLKWVQTNAPAFGGNPDDVTLMGQDSGAICAHLLSMSAAAKGLFHRVILLSGTANSDMYTAHQKYSKEIASHYLDILDIEATDPEEVHGILVDLPLQTLLHAHAKLLNKTGLVSFVPVVESQIAGVTRIIDDDPDAMISSGQGKDIPAIIGFTSDECSTLDHGLKTAMMSLIKRDATALVSQKFKHSLHKNTMVQMTRKITNKYFKGGLTLDNYSKFCSDSLFVYPAVTLAEIRAAQGGAPVFLYQFSYEARRSVVKEALGVKGPGAGHLEDVSFLFRSALVGAHNTLPPTTPDDKMVDWMTDFVDGFIRCGHPACFFKVGKNDVWPPVDAKAVKYQEISESKVYRYFPPTHAQEDMLLFFRELYNVTTASLSQK